MEPDINYGVYRIDNDRVTSFFTNNYSNQRYLYAVGSLKQTDWILVVRQEVSDAVERCIDDCGHDGLRKAHIHSRLSRFIIAKPDPLVEVLRDMGYSKNADVADDFRAAIEKRGGKIVWGEG